MDIVREILEENEKEEKKVKSFTKKVEEVSKSKEQVKKEDKETKIRITSKLITNTGIKPIPIRKNAREGNIVLQPKKSIRLENIEADKLINQYKDIEEVR